MLRTVDLGSTLVWMDDSRAKTVIIAALGENHLFCGWRFVVVASSSTLLQMTVDYPQHAMQRLRLFNPSLQGVTWGVSSAVKQPNGFVEPPTRANIFAPGMERRFGKTCKAATFRLAGVKASIL